MEIIIQRARERREEEEKRYQEQLQLAANLKLKKLDERILAEVKHPISNVLRVVVFDQL